MKIDVNKQELITILKGLNALEKEAKEIDMCMTDEFYALKSKFKSLA